ncbi:hypothetical protein ABZT27_35445 [Streptomyces sp. NPDC005389]|uniref:hypothetical protein n=1 Tax=Streptomyces sp. NPDC005389 TaxID=3157040 RepID=UPI00339EFA94
MQYIVTLNTDTLSTAAQRGFNPEPHIRSPVSPTTKKAAFSASASKPPARHSVDIAATVLGDGNFGRCFQQARATRSRR